ncbi:MAG TPA: hypothetical protein PKM50_09175, partial [Methanoregula sp.]|nr:hypothetical protein [Methanoregula sp.]
GTSSFAGFTTDADTVFVRKNTNNLQFTLLGGSYIDSQGDRLVNLAKKVDVVTGKKEENAIDYKILSDSITGGEVFHTQVDPEKIRVFNPDGAQMNNEVTAEVTGTVNDTGDNSHESPENLIDIIVVFMNDILKKGLSLLPGI